MFNYITCVLIALASFSGTIVAEFDEAAWEKHKKENPKPTPPKNDRGNESQKLHINPFAPVTTPSLDGFTRIPNVAQPGLLDFSKVIYVLPNITREEAAMYAKDNPEITYFYYVKEAPQSYRDDPVSGFTVFFSGEPTWLSNFEVFDGYIKE